MVSERSFDFSLEGFVVVICGVDPTDGLISYGLIYVVFFLFDLICCFSWFVVVLRICLLVYCCCSCCGYLPVANMIGKDDSLHSVNTRLDGKNYTY